LDQAGEPQIVRLQGQQVRAIITVAELPSAWGGLVRHNIANAMAAAALADGLDIAPECIQKGLGLFDITIEQSPGRFNVISDYPFLIIVDHAMSAPAAEALVECLAAVAVAGRKFCMLTSVGNRPNWHYRELIKVLGPRFDSFVCYEQEHYRRGRAPGEIAGILRSELLRHGVEPDSIDVADDYERALKVLSARPKSGDLVVVLGRLRAEHISAMRNVFEARCDCFEAAGGVGAGTPLPG
jgi:UDP-N-acetylmuramyl tripeptide synthase